MIVASIVLYNHKKEQVWPTIDSLLKTPEVQRIILVDNSSNCLWARALSDERIVYIPAPGNGGYGYGHNLAIKRYAPQSRYYLVCNPDIEFAAGQLTKLLDYAERGELKAGLYMPDIRYPDGQRQELCKLLPSPSVLFLRRFSPELAKRFDETYLLRHADFSRPFYVPSLSGCFMLFRSDALLALNGFDERYFMYMEDVDLSRRVAEKYGALYVPYAVVTHQFEKGSYKNRALMKAHIRSAVQYFNKWGWLFDGGRRAMNKRCLDEIAKHK